MIDKLPSIALIAVLSPLFGSLIAGLFGKKVGRSGAHYVTIIGVAVALLLSLFLAKMMLLDKVAAVDVNLYSWADGGTVFPFSFNIGFLLDPLSTMMMVVVCFVSLLVHIYSMGYMVDDPGYQRFFSYISLFTFAMLMLVTANNFLQLFFGWEGVGLVSYLLIGFWFKKESANQGSLKAFLVNRVGDFGFILGIGLLLAVVGSVDYKAVFAVSSSLADQQISLFPGVSWSVVSVICILLFIGAMAKSAQVPLHVWLPESMEGPTPISALIHAATMVTAGVFMVARMSPLFEYSEAALSFIIIIGATGALFTGLLAVAVTDIKRVVAYSTLSQLGYMMVAAGASAYSAAVFHLLTHACFKAVLFLAAGSVIISLHHEHDMYKMGGIWRKMPITYLTCLLGGLALVALPPFAGFYSKDAIIDAAHLATIPGAVYAYYCVAIGAFVTGLYTFRLIFLTFHGKTRLPEKVYSQLSEAPWSIWLPLVILAIPSVLLGAWMVDPMLFSKPSLLGNAIFVLPEHDVLAHMAEHYKNGLDMVAHAVESPNFWLAVAGVVTAWLCYILFPAIPGWLAKRFSTVHKILLNKYGFDDFNDLVFVRGGRALGEALFQRGDRKIIDGWLVNGSAYSVGRLSLRSRVLQSGYLFHYTAAMVIGLFVFLAWLLLG